MFRRLQENQAGIAFILVVVIVAAMGSGTAVTYTQVKQSQNQKKALEQQKIAEQRAAEAKAQGELKKQQAEEAKKLAQETPKPETPESPPPAQVKPTPPPAPKVTPVDDFTKCNAFTTAYATKKGGTPLYTDYYSQTVILLIPYGAQLQAKCQDGPDAAASYNGTNGAVRVEDIRKTKP